MQANNQGSGAGGSPRAGQPLGQAAWAAVRRHQGACARTIAALEALLDRK